MNKVIIVRGIEYPYSDELAAHQALQTGSVTIRELLTVQEIADRYPDRVCHHIALGDVVILQKYDDGTASVRPLKGGDVQLINLQHTDE